MAGVLDCTDHVLVPGLTLSLLGHTQDGTT